MAKRTGRTGKPTPAQMLILPLIAEGYRDKDIAECLNVTHSTVRTQVSSVLLRTHSRNRAHLAARWARGEFDALVDSPSDG